MSYNLLPLLKHRYILLVSQPPCVMLDTQRDAWIKVEMTEDIYEELGGAVQIGVFPLPLHAYSSKSAARRHCEKADYFELIYFGGIGNQLLSNVFHCSLTLKYDTP